MSKKVVKSCVACAEWVYDDYMYAHCSEDCELDDFAEEEWQEENEEKREDNA